MALSIILLLYLALWQILPTSASTGLFTPQCAAYYRHLQRESPSPDLLNISDKLVATYEDARLKTRPLANTSHLQVFELAGSTSDGRFQIFSCCEMIDSYTGQPFMAASYFVLVPVKRSLTALQLYDLGLRYDADCVVLLDLERGALLLFLVQMAPCPRSRCKKFVIDYCTMKLHQREVTDMDVRWKFDVDFLATDYAKLLSPKAIMAEKMSENAGESKSASSLTLMVFCVSGYYFLRRT